MDISQSSSRSIYRALLQMCYVPVADEKLCRECLSAIYLALVQADVPSKMICEMQANIERTVNLGDLDDDKRSTIIKALFDEFCKMLDAGKPSFMPKIGRASVIMFVGLQGSGKTTACAKFAYYYRMMGRRPALICADTDRGGAFDQLKQNAAKVEVPFLGSYMESDPIKFAVEGVEKFKKEKYDIIIVDAGGQHKQEASLFGEMRQVLQKMKPDFVILVIDSTIGQAAFDQAQAFKETVSAGAVILTKMDGHAKGLGALSAVAAAKNPVILNGTGQYMHELEVFDVKSFVKRFLCIDGCPCFINKFTKLVPTDQQPDLLHELTKGSFTMKLLYKIFQSSLKTGLIELKEGMPEGYYEMRRAKVKRYLKLMDLMTDEEFNCTRPYLMSESQMMTIARRSDGSLRDVVDMMGEFKKLAKLWNIGKAAKRGGGVSALPWMHPTDKAGPSRCKC